MSVYKTIIKLGKFKIMVQEYYNPHWLEFTMWSKEYDTGFYVLKRWFKVPLNAYARRICKLSKKEVCKWKNNY